MAVWMCTGCGLHSAISVINAHRRSAYLADLVAAAAEINRLRWRWRQIIALAEQVPMIIDRELRTRLLTLASDAR